MGGAQWSRTGFQHSVMVTPSSLLISLRLVRWMCRASLLSNVVLFFAWSNTLVSSPMQYWVMLSPGVLCYSRLLCLSPSGGSSVLFYVGLEGSLNSSFRHKRQGIWLLLQRVLVRDSFQLSAEGGCQSEDCSDVVSSAYLSHIFA